MRLTIRAIGRMGRGPEAALADDYLRRAAPVCRAAGLRLGEAKDWPESRLESAKERKAREAEALLKGLGEEAFAVALDEGGDSLDSLEFAAMLRDKAKRGVRDCAFLIGGPDGHGEAIASRCGASIRFGRMTWPHRLARVMLAEQIYRAASILCGRAYHRE